MLDLLVKYAQDHDLVLEPGFTRKSAQWAISCGVNGNSCEVVPLGDGTPKNRGREFRKCPDLTQPELKALKGTGSHFLLASCDVVALLGVSALAEKEALTCRAKHKHFVSLLKGAVAALPSLAAAAEVLEDPKKLVQIQQRLQEAKAKPTDKVTLMIDGAFPINSAEWHEWWRHYRRGLAKEAVHNAMVCLATGDMAVPAETHPKVTGLGSVGGIGMGTPFIGFDKDAFTSYNLRKSANGAVSEVAAYAYREGLNDLIANHSEQTAGMKVAHWFSHEVPIEDDPFAMIVAPQAQVEASAQKAAADLVNSIRSGKRADLANYTYYAITLSGSGGRVMTRDWMEGRFADLAANVLEWFNDLSIANVRGSALAASPGMERIVTCLLPIKKREQQYDDWVKPLGPERVHLWSSALRNTPIPFGAVGRLVVLHRTFTQTGTLSDAERDQGSAGLVVSTLQARMALLKAYHIRKAKGETYLGPYLNEDHPSPAYQCGRLMSVLARLQNAALGDVGAGVVQRYYASASSTPALVLGRLVRTSQFHLNKLDGGLAHWFEMKISCIWARIEDQVPTTLSLDEQSLFALGYYQQMAADSARKHGGETTETEKTNE